MQQTALLAGEAVADAELVTTVLKDATRRVRPAAIPAAGNFFDTWFESGGSLLRGSGSFLRATPSQHSRSPPSLRGAMEIIAGCHTSHTERPCWLGFPGFRYPRTFCPTSLWEARSVTRSAVLPSCGNDRRPRHPIMRCVTESAAYRRSRNTAGSVERVTVLVSSRAFVPAASRAARRGRAFLAPT